MPQKRKIRIASRPTGFTMVELLVVIAVITLLITLLTAAGTKVIDSQRRHNTEQIMSNVTLALDQFALEAPLKSIYGVKGRVTFGNYPPYQLHNSETNRTVAQTLELQHPLLAADTRPASLAERLAIDMSGDPSANIPDWAIIRAPQGVNYAVGVGDSFDDARALYTYMKLFSPASLDLIPDEYIKPLYPNAPANERSYVNKKGATTSIDPDNFNPNADVHDVLAIHDAWGVPLDYMLYANIEWALPEGASFASYVVTERRPALRSLGVQRGVFDAIVQAVDDPRDRKFDYYKWIFSEDLPAPTAGLINEGGVNNFLCQNGGLPNAPSSPVGQFNGWTRVVGAGDTYSYLPKGDKAFFTN